MRSMVVRACRERGGWGGPPPPLLGSPPPMGEGGGAYGQATRGGMDERMVSMLPPALRPNMVPRS